MIWPSTAAFVASGLAMLMAALAGAFAANSSAMAAIAESITFLSNSFLLSNGLQCPYSFPFWFRTFEHFSGRRISG
jgi:hypothetical protein